VPDFDKKAPLKRGQLRVHAIVGPEVRCDVCMIDGDTETILQLEGFNKTVNVCEDCLSVGAEFARVMR